MAYGVALAGNHAGLAVGLAGFQVIDLITPASPQIVGSVDTPGYAYGVAMAGSHAYVADGSSGLQVIDIADPASPQIVGSVDTPGEAAGVAVSGTYAFLADGFSALQVIDIANPASPRIVGRVGMLNYCWDVVVSGSLAYAAAGFQGLLVIDIADPASPRTLGTADTPGQALGVAVSGSHAYVTDYTAGLHVIDVGNPANPRIVTSVDTPGAAWGVTLAGSHAYVADDWSGLQVFDLTDPAHPQVVGNVDTPGEAFGATLAGSHVYLSDGERGLQVVPSQCEDPQPVHLLDLRVERVGPLALVRWSISMPQAHVGFRVWREIPGSARTLLGEAMRIEANAYEFTDTTPPAGAADYWLQEVTTDGSDDWYGPAHLPAAAVPAVLRLHQNQPNPFNPRTTLRYSLPRAGRVRLAVYDLRGARLAVLVDAESPAGEWSAEWDGRDATGHAVSSGVYVAKLESPAGVRTVKLTVTR
jgi:hypothetical protein